MNKTVKVVVIIWLALVFLQGLRHGVPNAVMATVLMGLVILAAYGVFLVARGTYRKVRA